MDRSLRVCIYGHGIPFSGRSLQTEAIGGTESMYLMMAEALQKRGHTVTVLTLGGEDCEVNGVSYLDYRKHRDYVYGCLEHDVVVIGRDHSKLAQNMRTKLVVFWPHDVPTDGVGLLESAYATDAVFALSDYHAALFKKKAPEIAPILQTTRNGIDLKLIDASKTDRRFPHSFIFGSRPERGLLPLLQHVWPRIVEQLPDSTLYLCGYSIAEERLPTEVKRIHHACRTAMEKSKNVVELGALPKEQWFKALWSTQVLLYSCLFPEISCLNIAEAQACGCLPITTHGFALPEVVWDPRNLVKGLPHQADYIDAFVTRALEASRLWDNPSEVWMRDYASTKTRKKYDIETLAEEWENFFWRKFLERSSKSPRKIIQQFIYNSDLLAAKHIIENTDLAPGCEDKLAEIDGYLAVQHLDPNLYANCIDTEETNPLGLPSRMSRALEMIAQHLEARKEQEKAPRKPVRARPALNDHLIEAAQKDDPFVVPEGEPRPLTLLDIGCGGGRFLNGVLKRFGEHIIPWGFDFSEILLASTKRRLQAEGYSEGQFHLLYGALETFTPDQQFDLLFAGEIVEHQQDIHGMLEKMFTFLKPGGLAVFTVPSGPWESLSYGTTFTKDGKELRFHVSHLELRDLLELFGKMPHSVVFDPLTVAPTDGSLLGNWVVSVENTGGPLGKIDYQRKFLHTRPYETISATIICKDAESDITRMLKSLHSHVDQIVLLDTGSTDRTLELVEDYNKVKVVQSTWKDSFSVARNEAISHVSPDTGWIYWMDCDEQLVNGHKLRRYTHTNLYNGYVILQNSLSIDSVQAPDVPVRLFKHNQGYRFMGRVHEHPQPSLNEVISPTLVLGDVQIVHYGFITESQRRQKVLERNLPLLLKDREENPDRYLGAVLLARDLLHTISWAHEARQSYELDEQMIRKLHEVLRLCEPFKDPSHLYYAVSLSYRQRALQMLGEQGYGTADGSHPFPVLFKLDFDPDSAPAKVWFANYHDLEVYMQHRLSKLAESLES